MRISKLLLSVGMTLLLGISTAKATLIVETFESFATGTIITTQISGLTISATGGDATITTATSPVVPGQPQGLYNDKPGVFSIGFEFPLVIDFSTTSSTVGAIVDFGVVGTGLMLTAFSGPGATGAVLGTASTSTESFLSVSALGILSARFEQAGASPASWLIDNLTYDLAVVVPEPTTLAIFGLGLAMLGFFMTRRRRVV